MKLRYRLWILSGDDYTIIKQCNRKTRLSFGLIGGFVGLLFILTFGSTLYAFNVLFESLVIGLLLGLFFATVITNIYLFLLYTFSKTRFPYIPNRSARILSHILRLSFVCFIAILISKPIESILLYDTYKDQVRELKCEKIAEAQSLIKSISDDHIVELEKSLSYAVKKDNQEEIYNIQLELSEQRKTTSIDLKEAEARIYESSFFIQGIVVMHEANPSCWLITILLCFLFITPALIKIFLPSTSDYYQQKGKTEIGLVKEDYRLFKIEYSKVFKNNLTLDIDYEEHFEDPPFNTIRKREVGPKLLTQEEFIQHIYNAI